MLRGAKQARVGRELCVRWRRNRRNVIRWYNGNWVHVIWMLVGVSDMRDRWCEYLYCWRRRERRCSWQKWQIADRLRLSDNRNRTSHNFLDDTVTVARHRGIQHQTIRPCQAAAGSQAEAAAAHPRRYLMVRIVYCQFSDKARKVILCRELHKFIATQVSGFECFVCFLIHSLRLVVSKFNYLSAQETCIVV